MVKVNMTDNARYFIIENLGEKWLSPPSINDLLNELIGLMTSNKALDKNGDPNEFGLLAESIHDEIFDMN